MTVNISLSEAWLEGLSNVFRRVDSCSLMIDPGVC